MSYGDFSTIVDVEDAFGLRSRSRPLFADVPPASPPAWLPEQLARGLRFPLMSEKNRGEVIVMPVLMAAVESVPGPVTIYSGARLDVDSGRGLVGECDFMVGRSDPLPEVRAPLLTIVEAKKLDIDAGLGQCAAQMVGARTFNEARGRTAGAVYGCVTTRENWQFLKLAGTELTVDSRRYFLSELDLILGVFRAIFLDPAAEPRAAA